MVILVVCEPTMFREGLGLLLQARLPKIELHFTDSAQRAVALRKTSRPPHMVLVDLGLPEVATRQGLETLAATFPGIPLIGLADDRQQPEVKRALGLGARMCVLKSASAEDLLAALQLADSSAICLPGPGWSGASAEGVPVHVEIRAPRTLPNPTPADLGLTPKQSRVLLLLLQGKSAKGIARELGLCTGTVKTHTTAVLRALNVNTRVQAVLAARRMGLQVDVCH